MIAAELLAVFRAWHEKGRRSVRVADVVRIESYDPATQTADITPVVAEDRFVDDERRRVPPITLRGCPVIWPGGALAGLTMGLQAGDEALAIFRTRDHDGVDAHTIADGELARGTRRMDLADAVVLPGYVRPAVGVDAARYDASGAPVIYLGPGLAFLVGDSTAAKALALAEKVDARLSTIASAFDGHVHTSSTSGSPTSDPTVALPPTEIGPLPSTACDDVKVRS